MAISSMATAGVGGWDYSAMLDSLATLEQQRLTPYTNLQSSCNNKISAWGTIKSLMTTLQDSVTKLNGAAFNTMTISTNTAFTATATDSAIADTHAVSVEQLASAHKVKTGPQESADTQVGDSTKGTRTVTITQGDKEIKVELSDDQTSLNQIAKAINTQNNQQGGNVSASVQRGADGKYQLMLSSTKTGTANEMTVSVEGDDTLDAVLNSKNLTEVSAAQDAKLTVDGTSYTESTNSVSDIIDGVTLNLNAKSAAGSDPEQLTLSVDTSAIKTTLQDFVKQYNALLSETSAESNYVAADPTNTSSTAKSGVLMGDSTLRELVNEFRSAVNGSYGSDDSACSSLADLGVTIDAKTGQMTLDEDKLDKAIEDNPDGIANMFKGSGDTEGLASTLGSILTKFMGDTESNTDGVIKTTTDSLNTQLTGIAAQITKTQALIDSQVELYRSQFANADALYNQMTNLQNTLTGMFAKL